MLTAFDRQSASNQNLSKAKDKTKNLSKKVMFGRNTSKRWRELSTVRYVFYGESEECIMEWKTQELERHHSGVLGIAKGFYYFCHAVLGRDLLG